MQRTRLTGQLAMIAYHTYQFICASKTKQYDMQHTPITLFFNAPFIFTARHDAQHTLIRYPDLVYLPIYLYLLRTASDVVRSALLLDALPKLAVDTNGAAAVIRLANGLIAHRHGGILAAMGIRTLYAAWKYNLRIWRILRSACADWIQSQAKMAHGSQESIDMELAVVLTLR
jgi:hypothetical protein